MRTLVAFSIKNNTIKVYALNSGKLVQTISDPSLFLIDSFGMSDDGRAIIAQGGAGHALIVTFDLKSGKSLRRFRLSEEGIRSSKFSKDAKLIVTKDYKDTIKVWSGATGKNIQTINGGMSRVYDFALSQDGKLIALAGDPSLKILELPTGKLIREMPKEASRSTQVAFSSDAKSIAGVGSFHGVETIGIWSTVTGDKEAALEMGATNLGVGSLLFAPDGRWIAGTTDGGFIQMWNRSSGRLSVQMYGVGDRNWLTTTPGAFFIGSTGSERLLNVTKGTERLPDDILSHRFQTTGPGRTIPRGRSKGRISASFIFCKNSNNRSLHLNAR